MGRSLETPSRTLDHPIPLWSQGDVHRQMLTLTLGILGTNPS